LLSLLQQQSVLKFFPLVQINIEQESQQRVLRFFVFIIWNFAQQICCLLAAEEVCWHLHTAHGSRQSLSSLLQSVSPSVVVVVIAIVIVIAGLINFSSFCLNDTFHTNDCSLFSQLGGKCSSSTNQILINLQLCIIFLKTKSCAVKAKQKAPIINHFHLRLLLLIANLILKGNLLVLNCISVNTSWKHAVK